MMRAGSAVKVLLVCSAGMSTSLLAQAMQAAAAAQGRALEVVSASASELPEALEGVAAALVAPQVRHRFSHLVALCQEAGVGAALIEPQVYGRVDGPAALAQALALAGAQP